MIAGFVATALFVAGAVSLLQAMADAKQITNDAARSHHKLMMGLYLENRL